MSEVHVSIIDREHSADTDLPNEPFRLYGRMRPGYCDGVWSCTVELFAPDKVSEMCFPDEHYDYDAMSQDSVFIGAYDDGRCIGLAVLRQAMFRYMYIHDIKVCAAYRGSGVGAQLIARARQLAREQGYRGVYAVAQDNNLAACMFYLKCGFEIGGLDTHVYRGTSQQGKSDITFYIDA